MPNIKLTDQFGLDLDAEPAPTSALLKYFQQVPSLHLDSVDLSKVGGLTLDEPAIRSLGTGVTFESPVTLGEGAPALSVSAGTHAAIQIISDVKDLPGFADDAPQLVPDTCYVSFEIDAAASADLSATGGALTFGAAPSTKVTAASYACFPLKAGVTLLEAFRQAVARYVVPSHADDLCDLPPGHIVQISVSGKLKLSGTADLLATANPLASVALPAPLPTVSVSAGGSVTVGATCEIEADFEVLAHKLPTGIVRIGWHHKNSSAVAARAALSEGISAGIGQGDLFSKVIGLISGDPKADLQELEAAGLSGQQAADIQAAVKAAVNRKLEIAAGARLSAASNHGATFLYEITPAALTPESRQAIDHALHGDLSALHVAGLPGLTCVRSIWNDLGKAGVELDVNLLGILNFRSIASLALAGSVLCEPATGALVITDTSTAERIRSTQVNFGADTQKLRHVLAESFLLTAAYHGAHQVPGGPALRCSHTFFELQNSTDRPAMTRKLQTGAALGLLSGADLDLPDEVSDFGRTLFTAAAEYDDESVSRMFLDSAGSPLPLETYEAAGRHALLDLVLPGDPDAVRRQPATDDQLWNRMKDIGQPGFPAIFHGVPAPLVGAITADYTTIQWWADAMNRTARELAAFRLWISRHPGATADDPDFQDQRKSLASRLRDVAATTREEFGQPWGLLAMYRLTGPHAAAKILISSPSLVRNSRRALTGQTVGSPS
jgi:hypothetical protein